MGRKGLEELQRQAGVNEVIMLDCEGHVTEGLQTNFFAVSKDGHLLTAPDEDVLLGTVRKLVLEVASQNGIVVEKVRPDFGDVESWDSCFICSTSRLVKPVLKLLQQGSDQVRAFPESGSVAHHVEALVLSAFRAHAEPLS